MTGPQLSKKCLPIYLLTALLILTLAYPTAAGAYSARSTMEAIPGYGIARSGGSRGFYSSLPPAPPKPPVKPDEPAVPEAPTKPETPPAGGETALNPQEQQLLNLVNSERANRGLAPLRLDAQLTQLARRKSQDMIDLNYFAHESPTFGSTGDVLKAAGIKFSLAAENIGKGGSVKGIFDAFMNSSGHRSKIVDSRYILTGIGVIYKPGRGYLVTQLFVSPR